MATPIVNGRKMEARSNVPVLFDASILQREEKIPEVFVWPPEDRPSPDLALKGTEMEVPLPIIDLGGFWKQDEKATKEASEVIGKACLEHGFFQVINHQVPPDLLTAAHQHMDLFFSLTLVEKQRAKRKLGESCGYASSFTDRFASKLPWKETLSFEHSPSSDVCDYFVKVMGGDFQDAGNVYKKYCEAMELLALGLMELLGMSLGVGRLHLREFFEGGNSIMRLNYYPPCAQPNLTLGTGPHCDPTSLTLLHQDEVAGLEIFINNKWHSVQPNTDAFVVNIGDTFMVGPQDIFVVAEDEYEDETTQSSSVEESQDDRYDAAASWETADSDGMHIHDLQQQVEEYSLCQIDAYSDHDIAHGKSAFHAEERSNQGNGGTLSISQAAFKFVTQLARGLLGFRESKMLSDASNMSNHVQCAQKHILDRTDLDIFEEKEFMRGSQCHLLESMDALYPLDDSAVLEGKDEAELCTPKDKSKYSGCRVDDQVQSFKECVDDLGEWTFNTVKKQKKKDHLSDLAASHNYESRHFKHLDIVKDPADHFFLNKTSQSTSQLRWTKKVQQEWAILEKNLPDTIYVRVYEDRMDLLRAVIIGAAGTPYQDGLFFFDIHLPTEYPRTPPSAHYHSGGLRLNPNLYENGKICLSLLNTWTGRGNEVWDPLNSSILQVLVSLQGLVLNSKPYFNEAGYDKQIGRAEGEKNSLAYNENAFLLSCKSMLYLLRKPPKHFDSFVREHFCQRGNYILGACNAYMMGSQVGCLSEEAMMGVHETADTQSTSSIGFKIMLAKLIPKLVSAFKEVGADCEEFLNVSELFGHVKKPTI